MNAANVRCKTHPRYQGIRFPRVECFGCVLTWLNRHYPRKVEVDKEEADKYITYMEVNSEESTPCVSRPRR